MAAAEGQRVTMAFAVILCHGQWGQPCADGGDSECIMSAFLLLHLAQVALGDPSN